jgi:hypothetical protein
MTAEAVEYQAIWLVTAVHEAGHLVVYAYYDMPIRWVSIWQDLDGNIRGSVRVPAGWYNPTMKAVACLAGPAAEEKLTGLSPEEQDESMVDLAMAEAALALLGDGAPSLEEAMASARDLVELSWPAIRSIAEALLQRGHLDHGEIVQLLFQLRGARGGALAEEEFLES